MVDTHYILLLHQACEVSIVYRERESRDGALESKYEW